MSTKLYVGNLPWRATEAQLTQLFGTHGEVIDAKIVNDRESGRSRGFGFVTMSDAAAAQTAISALNGSPLEGRDLVVNEARDQEGSGSRRAAGGGGGGSRTPYGGGGDRGGYRGGGGGGGGYGGGQRARHEAP